MLLRGLPLPPIVEFITIEIGRALGFELAIGFKRGSGTDRGRDAELRLKPFKERLLRGLLPIAIAPALPVLGLANTAEIGRAFGFELGEGKGNMSEEGFEGNGKSEFEEGNAV
ncbi:hypothetical protein FRC07_003592, partial [Ceratobasidium sp. 392]